MDSIELEEQKPKTEEDKSLFRYSEGILCGGCSNWIDECECDE